MEAAGWRFTFAGTNGFTKSGLCSGLGENIYCGFENGEHSGSISLEIKSANDGVATLTFGNNCNAGCAGLGW